jgi:hypothetical protein
LSYRHLTALACLLIEPSAHRFEAVDRLSPDSDLAVLSDHSIGGEDRTDFFLKIVHVSSLTVVLGNLEQFFTSDCEPPFDTGMGFSVSITIPSSGLLFFTLLHLNGLLYSLQEHSHSVDTINVSHNNFSFLGAGEVETSPACRTLR